MKNISRGLRLVRNIIFNRKRKLGPLLIEISPTSACNHNCYFCEDHSPFLREAKKPQRLSCEAMLQILPDIRKLKVSRVCLAGDGEPLLHNDLPKLLESMEGIDINIVTNGVLLDKISDAMFLKISKLTISLNSINNSTHRIVHGYRGEFQLPRIINEIKRLLSLPDAQNKIQVNYAVTSDNLGELEEVLELSNEWGVLFAIRPMFVHALEFASKAITSEQLIDLRNKLIAKRSDKAYSHPNKKATLEYAINAFQTVDKEELKGMFLPCYAGFYMGFIDSNGNYRMCTYNKQPLGNIHQQSLVAIWQSDSLQKLLYAAALMHKKRAFVCEACAICPEKGGNSLSRSFHRYFAAFPCQERQLNSIYSKFKG